MIKYRLCQHKCLPVKKQGRYRIYREVHIHIYVPIKKNKGH